MTLTSGTSGLKNVVLVHGGFVDGSGWLGVYDTLKNDGYAVSIVQNQRWVNVDDAEGERRRLFIARVSRIRGTYTFTSRLFVRGIAQYVSTDRDPGLYTAATTARSGTLSGQALISYKLNWQSVMFIGYGDDRELTERDRLEKLDRQFFVKLSYALQR